MNIFKKSTNKIQALEGLTIDKTYALERLTADKIQSLKIPPNGHKKNTQTQRKLEQNLLHHCNMKLKRNSLRLLESEA